MDQHCSRCGDQIKMHMGYWKSERSAGICDTVAGLDVRHKVFVPDLTRPGDVLRWLANEPSPGPSPQAAP